METLKADWIKLKKPILPSFYVLLYVEIQCHLIFAQFHVCRNQRFPIFFSFPWDSPVLKPENTHNFSVKAFTGFALFMVKISNIW